MKQTTQVYLRKGDSLLMMFRNVKENDISRGKWIGIGGKAEEGEEPEVCALRETLEETGIKINCMDKAGEVEFINTVYEDELIHIYTSKDFTRIKEPESVEGRLEWVPCEDLEGLPMWEGDRIFMPLVISGERFFRLRLEYDGDRLISASDKDDAVARGKTV